MNSGLCQRLLELQKPLGTDISSGILNTRGRQTEGSRYALIDTYHAQLFSWNPSVKLLGRPYLWFVCLRAGVAILGASTARRTSSFVNTANM